MAENERLRKLRLELAKMIREGNIDAPCSDELNALVPSDEKQNDVYNAPFSPNTDQGITIPDTLGDTLIWGAYGGTLPPERIEKPQLAFGAIEGSSLYATSQTSIGYLVVEFVNTMCLDNNELILFSNRVTTHVFDGQTQNHIRFSINKSTPDTVYGLWNQKVMGFDTRTAKQKLMIR